MLHLDIPTRADVWLGARTLLPHIVDLCHVTRYFPS